MAVLPLVIAPNPLLQKVSKPIEGVTQEIQNLAFNMLETMYENNGIGLSAVQVGVLQRLIVVDVEWKKMEDTTQFGTQYIMINPQVVAQHNASQYKEGCLSFPDEFVLIERPKVITVSYIGIDGTPLEIEADGLLATCIQHEIDHLNGKTISSYVSYQKKIMMFSRLKKRKNEIKGEQKN